MPKSEKKPKSLDELLENIVTDGPEEKKRGFSGHDGRPDGWYAVSDEHHGYIAYVAFEELAWALRLAIINARMNWGPLARRYFKADRAFAESGKKVRAAAELEALRVFSVRPEALAACPMRSLLASHYNPDGTCRCSKKTKPARRSSRSSKRAQST